MQSSYRVSYRTVCRNSVRYAIHVKRYVVSSGEMSIDVVGRRLGVVVLWNVARWSLVECERERTDRLCGSPSRPDEPLIVRMTKGVQVKRVFSWRGWREVVSVVVWVSCGCENSLKISGCWRVKKRVVGKTT